MCGITPVFSDSERLLLADSVEKVGLGFHCKKVASEIEILIFG